MSEIINITNWSILEWVNTGGTRNKKYVISPEGVSYYFKSSLHKPDKDYRYEFWNEILAYEIGVMLGFDILKYDIGINGDSIGCISKNMIDNEKEDLIQASSYLQITDSNFDPEDYSKRNLYTFQLIEKTLIEFELTKFVNQVLEFLVFDSIIGNGDRHQENWAFISPLNQTSRRIKILEQLSDQDVKMPWFLKWFEKFLSTNKKQIKELRTLNSHPISFAPIYDNGSCLCRELSNEKISEMLKEEELIDQYVNRGKSEIHWKNEKISHFELLMKIIDSGYSKEIKKIIDRVSKRYNENVLKTRIDELDIPLGNRFPEYKIPTERKSLIFKVLKKRIQILTQDIH